MSSEPRTSDGSWWYVFLAMVGLECFPIAFFRYFPSQDGPSHLHNALIVLNYKTEAAYQSYYHVTLFHAAGNLLTQLLLVGLVQLSGPLIAQKILLMGYIILLAFSFRYFLAALTPNATYLSFFVFILIPNWFFHMGFWNFCYSIGLLLLTLGYYARVAKRPWTALPLVILCVGGILTYESHVVSWAIAVIAVSILGLPALIASWRGNVQKAVIAYVLPLCSLFPPAVLLLRHILTSREASECGAAPTLRLRLWPLYSLSFLHTLAPSDLIQAKVLVAALFLLMTIVAVSYFLGRQANLAKSISYLALSLLFAAMAVFGPDCVGSGGYISIRLAFFSFLFLLIWLSAQSWPRYGLMSIAVMLCVISGAALAIRIPVYSVWNERLLELSGTLRDVRPSGTLLMVNTDLPPGPVNPYLHAAGLNTDTAVIDLRNYEAYVEYFTTTFRRERSPIPALGTLQGLASVPTVFDIERYEKQTQGHVDYVLVQGPAKQLPAFDLISTSRSGDFRLYQRR